MGFAIRLFWFGAARDDDNTLPSARARVVAAGPASANDAINSESDPRAVLVARLRASDVAAFDTLYNDMAPAVRRFARRLTGADDVADDIVHDVFLSLWIGRVSMPLPHGVHVYLFGAARRAAADRIRREKVAMHAAMLIDPDEPPGRGVATPSPGAELDDVTIRNMLRSAIQSLPRAQRAVLALRWTQGLTFPEIANVLGVSESAARQQVSRAQRALRTILEPRLIP